MKLEHRHYKFIAAILADYRSGNTPVERTAHEELVWHFAKALAGTNAHFDADRFFHAAMGAPSNGRDRT